jgi:hypothetical protein
MPSTTTTADPLFEVEDPQPRAVTAQVLVAEWIDACTERPPGQTVGAVSKHLKRMLEVDRIAPEHLRAGLTIWRQKGLAPATLASVVNQVMNGGANGHRRPGRADLRYGDLRGQSAPDYDAGIPQ